MEEQEKMTRQNKKRNKKSKAKMPASEKGRNKKKQQE